MACAAVFVILIALVSVGSIVAMALSPAAIIPVGVMWVAAGFALLAVD